jgi:general secretion pathway protein G
VLIPDENQSRRKKMKNRITRELSRGFTLQETLIWVGIVGVFLGIIAVSGASFVARAKVSAVRQEMKILSTTLLDYYNKERIYPSTETGLEVLYDEGYVVSAGFNDPWGTPYIYQQLDDGEGYSIKSLGSDKKEGGEGNKEDILVFIGEEKDPFDVF